MSAMSAGPSPLIRLRGIEKIYGQGQAAFHALRGIDLDVDEGDFIQGDCISHRSKFVHG